MVDVLYARQLRGLTALLGWREVEEKVLGAYSEQDHVRVRVPTNAHCQIRAMAPSYTRALP